MPTDRSPVLAVAFALSLLAAFLLAALPDGAHAAVTVEGVPSAPPEGANV